MEVLSTIIILCFAIGSLLEKAANLLKCLRKSGTTKLGKGFIATVCVEPTNKKSEDNAVNKSSLNDTLE